MYYLHFYKKKFKFKNRNSNIKITFNWIIIQNAYFGQYLTILKLLIINLYFIEKYKNKEHEHYFLYYFFLYMNFVSYYFTNFCSLYSIKIIIFSKNKWKIGIKSAKSCLLLYYLSLLVKLWGYFGLSKI